ncbi:MAG: sugar ABC transporter substrate-binding protein [Christensenellaceae bacterium]|nr:sugar ABC transporter substrate-binding protein [Christensenellaceae bacterium]
MKNTTKVILALVLVLVLAFTAFACAKQDAPAADAPAQDAPAQDAPAQDAPADEPAEAAGYKFGLSMGELTSAFCEGLRNGVQAQCDELGFECVYACADSDATKQATQIEDMISQGCDAVLCFATDTDAIVASAKACQEEGVIFAEFSRISTDLSAIDVAVGYDNKDQAYACGQAILDSAAAHGYTEIKVLELVGSLTDQNAIERQQFFNEFAAANGITVVQEIPTDWDKEKAYSGLKDAITACNGDFNAIYCPSDTFFMTCESVLTENDMYKGIGEEGHVIVVGIDGAGDAIKYVADKKFDMICNTDVIVLGKETVKYVVDILDNGATFDAAVMIEVGVITPENANDETLWGNAITF